MTWVYEERDKLREKACLEWTEREKDRGRGRQREREREGSTADR